MFPQTLNCGAGLNLLSLCPTNELANLGPCVGIAIRFFIALIRTVVAALVKESCVSSCHSLEKPCHQDFVKMTNLTSAACVTMLVRLRVRWS